MSLKVHATLAGGGLLEREEQLAALSEALSDARLDVGRAVLVAEAPDERGLADPGLAGDEDEAAGSRDRVVVGRGELGEDAFSLEQPRRRCPQGDCH